jgi:transposase
VLAGQGSPVTVRERSIGELTAWATHRTRRVEVRTATKNQLLGQLDRSFPGLTMALPDVLGTKVGRLVASRFADPARLAGLGVPRFIRFAATRGLRGTSAAHEPSARCRYCSIHLRRTAAGGAAAMAWEMSSQI